MGDRRTCPAPGCTADLPWAVYACRRHWYVIPMSLRGRINRAWSAFNADPCEANARALEAAHAEAQEVLDAVNA